ncbi:MAG: polymorphic toxin-type HINT domain-containing protein, partial [Patescibacteria group bacterium]|nr:polymorphic toxin-type HINT domain-containing protein [Patescibacteria group bacterium]
MSEEGEIFGSGRALVFGPDIYLQSYQSEESDNTYKFTTKLNNIVLDNAEDTSGIFREEYIGSPVKNYPVLAKIIKITYRKIEVGEYYDYINKIVQKKYNYKREEEIVESINGTTDINGEWSFSRNFSKEENSTYRIDFISHDSQDKNIKNSTYVWRSPYTHWKDFQVSLNINGNSYHEEFSNGDKINLDLQIVEGEKPDNLKTLFYRYQNNIDKTNIVSSLDYEEIFEGAFAPSVQYRAVVLGPYGFEESNSVTASFNETDNKLSINIEQDKEKYRPGEQINLNLNVKDQRNQGVISEVNVAVVDEALFHVLPYDYYRKDILSNLYRDIWTNPLTHASQYDFLGASGAEGGGCFTEGTKILMWDGSLKNIEDVKVGDQILTRSDSQNNELDIAITQGVSQHFVRKYLIINDFLGVTPEHRLYVNNDWVYAGNIQIGDELLNQDGEIIIVESMETREGLVPVYNIIVNEYHTYFADGFYVHNGEKGGQARVHFVDTAFFDTVSTDRHGDSSIYFMAPDNITSWRVTAQAFATESLKAGQNIKLVKTSLPFFVDVSLNNFYLVGDSPILRVRAFGEELSQTAGVEFEVKSESLGIDEKVNSSNNFAYIPLGNLSEGEHEIIISGKQGGNKDAIIRKISVVRSYFKKSASSFYKLSDGLSNIEGNKDGFTKIKFMDLGRGRLYRALLSHKYNSGIRADQVVAKYLSKKYLLDCFDGPWVEQSLDLSGYHLKNDGLGLFPYGGEDLALTAKLSDLVPEFIFKGNVKNYLRSSLVNDKADIHRISKALYGLASLDELVLTKINLVKDDPALNIEDRI